MIEIGNSFKCPECGELYFKCPVCCSQIKMIDFVDIFHIKTCETCRTLEDAPCPERTEETLLGIPIKEVDGSTFPDISKIKLGGSLI